LAASQSRAAASSVSVILRSSSSFCRPRELDLDDPAHLALLQAVEQDDLVDAVEEFGPEMRPHHPHHLLAYR
jgi:hypothetical protein